MVPTKGKLSVFAHQLVGGVRSGMGYCGARTISDFWKRAEFVRVTAAGFREGHPHDVTITKESPNYFQVDG
jgi:IMP dehydrogenase